MLIKKKRNCKIFIHKSEPDNFLQFAFEEKPLETRTPIVFPNLFESVYQKFSNISILSFHAVFWPWSNRVRTMLSFLCIMHYRGRASVLHEFSSRIEHCTRGVVAINFALNATAIPEDGGSRELLENRKTASPPTIFHSSKKEWKEASFIFSVSSRVFPLFSCFLPPPPPFKFNYRWNVTPRQRINWLYNCNYHRIISIIHIISLVKENTKKQFYIFYSKQFYGEK